MQSIRTIFLSFLVIAAVAVSAAIAQDLVFIANPDVSDASLSASDVQNIYLGNKTSWGNGSKINFITTDEAGTHESFLQTYVGKSSAQFQTYWKKQVFTGKGKMPTSVNSSQEMVNQVSSTSGAIGYVSAGTDLGSAKTLSVK